MRPSRVVGTIAAILASLVMSHALPAQSPWQQPAADLASQIAAILGHGAARLMIRNLSSLPVDDIPAIRKLLEQDLRALGVVANSAPNDTVIRVTLSDNSRAGTWVAEVIKGDDDQVAVVNLPPNAPAQTASAAQFILRNQVLIASKEPVLSALELPSGMVLLTPSRIVDETRTAAGWAESHSTPVPARLPLARDPRGMLTAPAPASAFQARLPGSGCLAVAAQAPAAGFAVNCHPSDDPWPLTAAPLAAAPAPSGSTPNPPPNPPPSAPPAPQIRAFYNAARNYFTGVISPGVGVDLPPFYSAVVLQRASGPALLIAGIDGKVLLASSGFIATVSGTGDWGSDLVPINSGCGDGSQVIVSGAGDSSTDTLRAYQIKGAVAEPASQPLTIDGTVTALQSAPDGKSVLAVIRNLQNQYEVDRVTALCN